MDFALTPDIKSIFQKDLVLTVMKRNAQALINMIQSESNLINTIHLALANPDELGKSLPLYKGCLNYIIKGPPEIREYIAYSAEFIFCVNTFISEIQQKSEKQIVAFHNLISSFLDLQNLNIISRINNPFPYLLPFVSKSCIGFTVTKILLSFTTIPSEYIDSFIEYFPKEDYAIYWFRSALNEKKSLVSLDDAPRLADCLLSLAITKQKSIFTIQCYEICWILKNFSLTNQLLEVLQKYLEDHDEKCSFAVKLFNDISIDMVFELPENSILNNAIISNFKQLSKEEKVKMVEECDLTNKIISLSQRNERSSVVFDLGENLNLLGSSSPKLQSPAWTQLCKELVAVKQSKSLSPYGGPIKSKPETTEPPICKPASPVISGLNIFKAVSSPIVGSPVYVQFEPISVRYQ
ncbi:hypothetical protein TVAG_137790 [Trichomonas vaginalis G3]|uniref:Uncharacterized protein n=1 Tax=Trichomonas vaginalis (strain ATCC PRA-98 / G3) TaxID=412133 RepID=A2EC14_TRIV3|nr:hypothetical protein TVAGG3_0269350 [Trichomonas vaginalis G3]EAY09789.1 hypothetical protein TVAG_137790 [Trichomonas vaginalis G3]KAI5525740.1 hypothetical protein TVAGG3_0269350 [Trichomonas vaginalis G3]|eukprot:XP_001322012.1 hypothetical protein [Trichomonas vaginalis G3]